MHKWSVTIRHFQVKPVRVLSCGQRYLEVFVCVSCELGAVHVQTAQTLHGWNGQTMVYKGEHPNTFTELHTALQSFSRIIVLCVFLQLRASRPASVTGVSHRFNTCKQARCSDNNRNPASPNWKVNKMAYIRCLCDCLCCSRCSCLPVWTRGWAVWATAAWWAARHRHWWRWWRPGLDSPNSQKNLNSVDGPGLHPMEC